jgi:hypothetical protein
MPALPAVTDVDRDLRGQELAGLPGRGSRAAAPARDPAPPAVVIVFAVAVLLAEGSARINASWLPC